MQRMISHDIPLPACSAGHPARHMHDTRCSTADGGHYIECKCSHTSRHENYDGALREWRQMHGAPTPPAAARERQPAAVITTLNSTQREAMRRAMAGDFELADAMELLSPGRMRGRHIASGYGNELDLMYGVWIGGRLQAFAYGQSLGPDDEQVRLVLSLNGAVLFPTAPDQDHYDLPDCYADGRTPVWASTVLEAYHQQLACPQQQSIFQTAEAA
ncbi:MAG: hypothetical protein J0I01_05850 [Stenotrophomonas nitritireducens]|uniref:hypothetical protein n=1 Tax=Stenotrophomonas nitritireducens TaxID=83617 RepID=UPI001AC3D839|nr:hypothetical protein [Stenotrophomonas nitritireducens]MBN8791735.1 hypothetical protein [Stenotrophomonas nitritireducens]MBN8795673.1 hypothetical protein [Stenotrophomonas nitritireducens]